MNYFIANRMPLRSVVVKINSELESGEQGTFSPGIAGQSFLTRSGREYPQQ